MTFTEMISFFVVFFEKASFDFPILRPFVKQTIKPGPAVAATLSISFIDS